MALGNALGTVHFSSDENCTNHVIADGERSNSQISVTVSTLDEQLSEIPFIMKMDVEGYESPALQGAKHLLNNDALCVVIVELNGSGDRYGYDESEILELMASYGFQTYSYEPFERALVSLAGKNSTNGNTIFVRNVELVSHRLSTAQKFTVHGVSV